MTNPNESSAGDHRAASVRTVLVDDHLEFRDELSELLRRHRAMDIVGVAENGQQAVDLTRDLKPDLVVMDINMPEKNGIAATREIKKLPNPPRVVLVSFESARWGDVAAREAGADGFCDKVRVAADLLPMIKELFPA